MQRNLSALLSSSLLVCCTSATFADDARRFDPNALGSRVSSDVFGYTHREGFQSRYGYRIPVLVVTPNDVALAIIERRRGIGDHAQNDIVLRRSTDGGVTWGDLIVIDEQGERCLCNPCAVVLPDSGRVLVMYQEYFPDRHSVDIPHMRVKRVNPGYEGDDVVRTYITYSDDDGLTWSERKDISRGTKREGIGPIGCGPGIGIVLTQGEHAGRIVIPFNETQHDEQGIRQYYVYASYSDDGGETWQVGDVAPFDPNHPGSGGEVQMAELSDGRVMLNSRSSLGKNLRKISISSDGGHTWSPVVDDEQLPEPVCMGSILRVKEPGESGKHFLLFSCPASQQERKEGTLYASYDDGETWSESWVLEPNDFSYSCLTQFADGSIGCLYEGKGYRRIIFTRFPLEHFFRNAVKK